MTFNDSPPPPADESLESQRAKSEKDVPGSTKASHRSRRARKRISKSSGGIHRRSNKRSSNKRSL